MAELIIMPKLGFNMNEGKLVQWYKKEGEPISKGEPLFSVETDKTNMDIEATGDGIVRKLFIGEGDTIPVTLPIAIVGSAEEEIGELISNAQNQLGSKGSAPAEEKPALEEPKQDQSTESAYDYDIAVIGGGPGGYVAAIKGAQMGKKTVIIEQSHYGGTCLNEGCIPTKALLRSAEALREVKESGTFGVINTDIANAALDLKKVQTRKQSIVKQLVGGVQGLLKGNGVISVEGQASIKAPHTIEVDGKTITAADIIIATGSETKTLPIEISKDAKVLTSKELLELEQVPVSVAVIGGGVIGIEFAYFLASIGVKVTVIEFLDQILPMVDEEITRQVSGDLQAMGIELFTGAKVTSINAEKVTFEKDGKTLDIEAEQVLMAVGRKPNLTGIDTDKLGIKTDKGAIVTDGSLRTSVEHIYAIGDVNGKSMLAHTASMEGIMAVKTICGEKAVMDYSKIPSAIYLQPEIASVGLTEKQAKEQYGQIHVGKFPLAANGKAKVAGEERGIAKVISEARYGEIVGVHLYCIHATDMISEAVVAMNLESTAEEIAMSIHPHPTVSEVIHEAMHGVTGKAIHFI